VRKGLDVVFIGKKGHQGKVDEEEVQLLPEVERPVFFERKQLCNSLEGVHHDLLVLLHE
jgi:hypothetical protein